jgi:hypothetical protein
VTMLPTDRSAGVCTAVEGCLEQARQYTSQDPAQVEWRNSHQQIDESPADTALNDRLDLVVRPVREVADRPARIDEDLVVERVDELGKNGESRSDLLTTSIVVRDPSTRTMNTHHLPFGLRRLATAEVAECPSRVAEGEKGLEGTRAKNVVTALGRVTGNVTECPNAARISRGRVTTA